VGVSDRYYFEVHRVFDSPFSMPAPIMAMFLSPPPVLNAFLTSSLYLHPDGAIDDCVHR
jgi:hypothetical protein